MSEAAVEAYLSGLPPPQRAAIDTLRRLVMEAGPGLNERIKWNAPSFAVGDEDRITLGLSPKGGVRAVLHRGAKAKNATGFVFADEARLATWPAPDRGVLTFTDAPAIEAQSDALRALFARWLEATASPSPPLPKAKGDG